MAGPTEILDRESFRLHWQALLSGFPDLRFEILSMLNDQQTGHLHWYATGSHDAIWQGIAATHQMVKFSGVSILRFDGARACTVHDIWDRRALVKSLHQSSLRRWARTHSLTPRQFEVVQLMASRLTHVEIANSLGVRPNTARRHCEAVMVKLGVHRRADVIALLRQRHGNLKVCTLPFTPTINTHTFSL